MGANEGVIREMRIGAADTIDLGGLAWAEDVVRVSDTARCATSPCRRSTSWMPAMQPAKPWAASKNAALASVTSIPRCSSAAGICPARAAA